MFAKILVIGTVMFGAQVFAHDSANNLNPTSNTTNQSAVSSPEQNPTAANAATQHQESANNDDDHTEDMD